MVDKKVTKQVKASLQENVTYLNSILPVSESFDLIQRDMIIGEKQSTFYFIDGFTKDETMLKIMTSFFALKKDDMPSNATGFSKMALPYVEVDSPVCLLTDMRLALRLTVAHIRQEE